MPLADAYKKIVKFLNSGGYNYIIIGGIAASTIGEPRVTVDIDINKEDVPDFLNKAKKAGFKVPLKKCIESVKRMGVFQISFGDYHIDFIIASTELEKEVFERAKTLKLYGIKTFFPSSEDLILLKIIPGRDKDLLDVKSIILRHKGKLDTRYLKTWARKLCDEAEDMRIWNVLDKLLKD
jgi:predicted nucleotidyltransferase